MPATTPRLGLPYPIPDDSVDVPRDVQALATRVDAINGVGAIPRYSGAFPTLTPNDGDEIYYSPGPGLYWHLLWSASGSKWYCVGGAPLIAVDSNSETRGPTGAPYPSLFALNPASQIPVPATGVYDVSMEAMWLSNNANRMNLRLRPSVDGSTLPGTVDSIVTVAANSSGDWRQWSSESRLNLVGGTTIQIWAGLSETNTIVRLDRKQLRIKPVYLG